MFEFFGTHLIAKYGISSESKDRKEDFSPSYWEQFKSSLTIVDLPCHLLDLMLSFFSILNIPMHALSFCSENVFRNKMVCLKPPGRVIDTNKDT